MSQRNSEKYDLTGFSAEQKGLTAPSSRLLMRITWYESLLLGQLNSCTGQLV